MKKKKSSKKKSYTKGMSRGQVEKLSKRNAIKIIKGDDKLKSWGTTGWYRSKKLNKYYKFRSMIEANVIKTLDESEYIIDFDTEQFMIPYTFKGAQLNYVPDVIFKTQAGNVFVVEVKPTANFKKEKNRAKWKAAKNWCWNKGVRFFVISEKDWPNLIDITKSLEDKNLERAQQLLEWTII